LKIQIIELPNHPFYVGAQFHPEYKSRPGKPSPLFLGLIGAASGELDTVLLQSYQETVVPRSLPNGKLERVYWKGAAKKPVSVVYSLCDRVYS
jgi:CTP synthase